MLWLWILGILAALILLLCRTRVGIHVGLHGGETTADVKLGPFRIRVLPAKKKPKKAEKPPKEPKEGKEEKPKKAFPKIAFADVKDAVRTLAPPLKKALARTRRGIRVQPLDLRITLGGSEDPAAAAEQYGYFHAGVWTVMPVLEQLLVIPDPYIHVGIDFDAPKTVLEGEAGISIRIGTLLAVGFGVGIPALRWFLRFQKKQKQQPKAETAEAAETAAT
ncbi:DUF2953 domain-containing protein [uncultured Dysosmobacter sp.]|uniref:DUF2953 domain-containing protein n=1 Tax=uncultured Dysosmobacter sp. TaxID=2591384 RepID=UPI00261D2392|nr:DUF2953 domain-containing protein [uncultured Dysosmobacter sp.]